MGLLPGPLSRPWMQVKNDIAALIKPLSQFSGETGAAPAPTDADAERILEKHFNHARIARQYAFDVLVARMAFSRGVRWIGFVSCDNTPLPILKTTDTPPEIWALISLETNVVAPVVAAEIVNYEFRSEWPLEPGALLFAPGDGRTTAESLELIREFTKMPIYALPTVWPDAWPINRR